jgi:hypothetical protein
VRPFGVVVLDVLAHQVVEVLLTEHQAAVEPLSHIVWMTARHRRQH